MAQTCRGDSHQDIPSARLLGLHRLRSAFSGRVRTERRHGISTSLRGHLQQLVSSPRSKPKLLRRRTRRRRRRLFRRIWQHFAAETHAVPASWLRTSPCGLLASRLPIGVISNCPRHYVNFASRYLFELPLNATLFQPVVKRCRSPVWFTLCQGTSRARAGLLILLSFPSRRWAAVVIVGWQLRCDRAVRRSGRGHIGPSCMHGRPRTLKGMAAGNQLSIRVASCHGSASCWRQPASGA